MEICSFVLQHLHLQSLINIQCFKCSPAFASKLRKNIVQNYRFPEPFLNHVLPNIAQMNHQLDFKDCKYTIRVMGRTPFYQTLIELEHHFSNIELQTLFDPSLMNESVNFSNLGSIETFEYRHTKKFFTLTSVLSTSDRNDHCARYI